MAHIAACAARFAAGMGFGIRIEGCRLVVG